MKTCGGVALVGTGIVGLIALIAVLTYAQYEYWLPWRENKRTEITRNTNQFVDSQVAQINSLVAEYEQTAEDIAFYKGDPKNDALVEQMHRQQDRKAKDMCALASKIDAQYVPQRAVEIMAPYGCYTPQEGDFE